MALEVSVRAACAWMVLMSIGEVQQLPPDMLCCLVTEICRLWTGVFLLLAVAAVNCCDMTVLLT